MIKKLTYLDTYGHTEKKDCDLSLSENPLGSPEYVKEIALNYAKSIHEYPRHDYSDGFVSAVSKKFNVDAKNIVYGHGSSGLMEAFISCLFNSPEDTLISPDVTFDLIEIPVSIRGSNIINSKMTKDLQIDIDDIKSKITDKTRLVFVANPNNPTGRMLDVKDILSIAKHLHDGFLLVDEANIEFNPKCQSAFDYVKEYGNVIVLRTLSKAHGLAGIRLGYAFANHNLIRKISQVNQLYDTNSLALLLGKRAMEDDSHIQATIKAIEKNKKVLTDGLSAMKLEYLDSSIHTICIKTPSKFKDNHAFASALSQKDIAVVHQYDNFDYIRVVAKSEEKIERFLKSLNEILKQD